MDEIDYNDKLLSKKLLFKSVSGGLNRLEKITPNWIEAFYLIYLIFVICQIYHFMPQKSARDDF